MTQHPAVVLFDWDNTISDTFAALCDSYNYILTRYGHSAKDAEWVKNNIRRAGHEAFPDLFGDKWEEALTEYRRYYNETHGISPVFDGVGDLLETLKRRGIPMGVISNKIDESLQRCVDEVGLRPYFSVVMGSVTGEAGKPDPSMMVKALKRIGYKDEPETVWYVGDTDIDMQFAANSLVRAVFVENAAFDTIGKIEDLYAPHRVYRSVREFSDDMAKDMANNMD